MGLDVVARNIQALRGLWRNQNQPGQGSRFVIRLPLTLAIIDGFLTAVSREYFIVPLDAVVECIRLPSTFATGISEPARQCRHSCVCAMSFELDG